MADLPTRAFSVHAPWAWAFFHARKDVENRSANFPKYLGRVWVHASLWPGPTPKHLGTRRDERLCDESAIVRDMTFRSGRDFTWDMDRMDALRGHILGSVEIYGRATPDAPPDSLWYSPGNHGILVRDPVPLARPVPAKGALGLWTVKPETLEELRRAA